MSKTSLAVILALSAFWGGIFTESEPFSWQFWLCALIANIAGHHLTKEERDG